MGVGSEQTAINPSMILNDAQIKPVVDAVQIQVGVRLRHVYNMYMTKPL
jgi:hypothetical protein